MAKNSKADMLFRALLKLRWPMAPGPEPVSADTAARIAGVRREMYRRARWLHAQLVAKSERADPRHV
jgi:hypothetical protein